jgi:1,4-dihydroxy-2-naphthoyl-CoA synthase
VFSYGLFFECAVGHGNGADLHITVETSSFQLNHEDGGSAKLGLPPTRLHDARTQKTAVEIYFLILQYMKRVHVALMGFGQCM